MTLALKYAIGWCIIVLTLLGGPPAEGQVLINEIMADPDSDWNGNGIPNFRDDEWVEVINQGPGTVELSLYFLRDITGETNHLQLNGQLEPGQVAVFFGSQAVEWQQANSVPVSGLSLNNSGDTIELITREGEEFVVQDTLVYLDHEAEDERSSGLDPETGQWMLFDGLNPYEGTQIPLGTGCFPSPGEANSCAPQVPVQNATLDEVKSLYRKL